MGRPAVTVRILNTECGRFSEDARSALARLGQVDEVEADRDYLLANVAPYDVLCIALRNTIDRQILERAEHLKCIVTPTTGVNHVDLTCAEERGVTVLSLRGETEFLRSISATAELTWGLLLALLRRIPAAHGDVLNGRWVRDDFYGHELRGKTLGVVGHGRLGTMVAGYGKAFGMNVLAYDRHPAASPDVQFVALEELLERSDVVSLHLALTENTRGLFNAALFSRMKPGAVFINTARGEITEETALVEALRGGRLAGAAVDVLSDETSIDPNWLDHSPLAAYARSGAQNVLITPHIGGVTHESVEKANLFMIRKLENYLREMGPSH